MLLADVNDLAHLAQVKSLWDVMGYPKLWGSHERAPYYYRVMMVAGAGGHFELLRTNDRDKALALLPTLPAGGYVAMHHSQTHALLGEQGRASTELLNLLAVVLAEWEKSRVTLIELSQRRVDAEFSLKRDLESEAELNSAFVRVKAQYEAALNQARVLVCACLLPPETVTW